MVVDSGFLLDACALFGFFSETIHFNNPIKLGKESKKIKRAFDLGFVTLFVPVPALSEFFYKIEKEVFKNHIDHEKYIELWQNLKKNQMIKFLPWDLKSFARNIEYRYINREEIKNDRRSRDIFDSMIYCIAKVNQFTKIISKDRVFGELYDLERIW